MGFSIVGQQDARRVWKRASVCYLCGKPLPVFELEKVSFKSNSPEINRDHVPPEKLFAPEDRGDYPLLLRTHVHCNGGESADDQKMSELFRLIWNQEERANLEALALEWEADQHGSATASFWNNDNVPAMVFRWIRGFHYALYDEFLPANVDRATLLPFLEIKSDGASRPHPQYFEIAKAIRRQRMTKQMDRISAYNGRLNYECAWYLRNGLPTCIYALDVNGWSIFSGGRAGPYRSGLGCYVSQSIPSGASQLSRLHFPCDDVSLDLFPTQRVRYIGPKRIRKVITFRGGAFPGCGPQKVKPITA